MITSAGTTIFGQPNNVPSEMGIHTNESRRYDYSMGFSLKGCAVIQKVTVTFSENSELFFLVAFKNSTIQFKDDAHSKFALLLLNEDYINKQLDVCYFDRVMKNTESCPTFDGCLQDSRYKCTYLSSFASKQNIFGMEYNRIRIEVSMTGKRHCNAFVRVTTPKTVTSAQKKSDTE